jgi:septum site-determining protein MinC
MRKAQARKPLEIKISTVVAVAAILHETDLEALNRALHDVTGGDPDYFEDEFALIDLGALDAGQAPRDWPALIGLFKSYRLNPVAVRNASSDVQAEVRALGLSVDHVRGPAEASRPPVAAEAASVPAQMELAVREEAPARVVPATASVTAAPAHSPSTPLSTMIIDTPVRSGQRIYARGCDLIVTAAVNDGAEIIADGSIHVYAPLRGRALAGASGNAAARIFTLSMEAELVSIAGMYRTFDDALPKNVAKKAVQIRLSGDRIEVNPIAGASPSALASAKK